MGLGSVLIYSILALLVLLFLSSYSPFNHHSSHRHRRLKLRSNFTFSLSHSHHPPVPFDPLLAELERNREDKQWEQQHIHHSHPQLHHHDGDSAPAHESQPEWEDFMNAEDFINDEDKFNVTSRLLILFPKIDVDPADSFIDVHELTMWNLQQAHREVLHRSQREMELHDKNHDGVVSFSEYDPPTWVKSADKDSFGYDMGWWKEEHFNASDADGDGVLNLTEFNDFLHPADSNNTKLQQWLCKEEVRERDSDRDGKVNFKEFFHGLFDLVRNYDEEESHTDSHHTDNPMDVPARKLFAQLDQDGDGYLSDTELLPIIGKLHPSEYYYAKQQAEYIISQVNDDLVGGNADFYDPLRGGTDNDAKSTPPDPVNFNETSGDQPIKEWTSFRRLLMQRFPVSKMVSLSSMPDVLMRSGKSHDKSATSMHLEELDDPKKFADEGVKVITWQEYVSRLHELKDEITRSWLADNRVTSLKLSIKVAKLMVDTSVSEFYPTLFVLVTDIMDMLGDLVWKRIKQKAEFTEDGALLCNLAENFEASDICADAKETCYNWFSKIGAVQDLLPRIYLELAILPCRRFLLDQPTDSLQRLVMMTRGLGDPVASAYCRLYMAHCAQKLPSHDIGYLVTCVNDLKVILTQTLATNERNLGNFQNNKKLQISLMEPTIEYIMKCIFIGLSQRRVNEVLSELGLMKNQQNFGTVSCVSLVLHHLLKELPIEVVSSNVVHILHLIEFNNDNSFHQHLNYRLLGFRLYEGKCPVDIVNAVLDKVMQVIAMYKSLDEYLKVIDAYADLILQNHMDNHLDIILRGISERALNGGVTIDEMSSLQSLLVKFLSHFECLEDVFCLNHFPEILDILHGKSQDVVFLHILNMATRSGRIRDPTRIQLLFEISRTLHDNMEFINAKNDDSQVTRSVSRFVYMVDYGAVMEHHLAFLVDCRASFGRFNELKETLVHSSNSLAIQSLQCAKKDLSFFKSCVTFSEVTIPSISGQRQFDLFLETAEVAFLGGLVSHVDGLIDSGIRCLHILDRVDGFRTPADIEGLVSSIRKLCGFLIMVPGNISLPVTYFPNNLFSLISSQSWFDPKMKTQIFSAILLLLTTLSQKTLPYHANTQMPGNDMLYYGDSSYKQELESLSKVVLENLLCAVQQEPSQAARGSMALEACNCIASSFMQSNELSSICHTLIGTAKSCLSVQDRCLQSTIRLINNQLPTLAGAVV